MRTRRTSGQDAAGFTLIELLVVILIIGVLAAIAIPTYLKQRERGWRAAAVADMKNAATAVETYATDHGGTYIGLDGADQDSPILRNEGFNQTVLVSLEVIATESTFCLRGFHERLPTKEFVFRSGTGVVDVGAPAVLPC